MISGIMPCSGWSKTGYPWRLAMRTWARVCDELVVPTHGKEDLLELLPEAARVMKASEGEGRRCEVWPKLVEDPPLTGFGGYGAYLMYGTMMASDPDWVLAVEADYLISPAEAKRLRDVLNGAPGREVVMARAVTLNYDGTRRLFNPDFKNWYPPKDGVVWDRPIGCRPGRGVFPAPYNGTDAKGVQMNCEGFVCLRPGKWGASFNSKFLNHNPNGLDVMRTDVEFEHLTYTRDPAQLVSKLAHSYFASCGMSPRRVLDGNDLYERRYAELDEVAKMFAGKADWLRKFVS